MAKNIWVTGIITPLIGVIARGEGRTEQGWKEVRGRDRRGKGRGTRS